MAAAFWSHKVNGTACFEMYFRRLPANRSFIVIAGLEQALKYITGLRFTSDQIHWLRRQEVFGNVSSLFWEYLRNFRFTGEVWAVREGTVMFPLEPYLQVQAPLIEAQILETYLLTMMNMQSLIATKAARIVAAASGREVIDFGARRAHGPQAAVLASRAAFIGGCSGSSNVLAGYLGNIPIHGTAAHSFTMAFDDELKAFRAYHETFPESTTLLIDTYDTLEGARKVSEVGPSVKAVRIDSGDLLLLSRQVRSILDDQNLRSVKIMASGDLNEYKIRELVRAGAPIDYYGVGTELVTSYDAPALGGVYKLVETTIDGRKVMTAKSSPGKPSYPGRKQVYRFLQNGRYIHDQVRSFHARHPSGGLPLLQCYIKEGRIHQQLPSLKEIQQYARDELRRFPDSFLDPDTVEQYSVMAV
jgi:nicotinate phosphoribosyltransferase